MTSTASKSFLSKTMQVCRGPWPRRALKALAALLALSAVVLMLATAVIYPQLPDLDSLTHYQPKQPLRVFTADGVQIGSFGTERRVYQRIDQIPQLMKDSLLAVEDSRFYEHAGIDPIGVARAVVSVLSGGLVRRVSGGSTITQQVARTFLLTNERTVSRKFKEALLSLRIESALSKDQVLELYMNQIYLGSRAYGFEAAAQTYFGKTLATLSPAECAMLAGLPQNPRNVNPIRNPERAHARQRVALARMHTQGVINDTQYAAAKAEKLVLRKSASAEIHAEYVAEAARQQVFSQFGEKAYTQGFDVTTTLVAAEQQAAYQALRRTLIEHAQRQPWHGPQDHENLPADLQDDDPAVAQALSDLEDDEDLRVAIVTSASQSAVTVVLASGEIIKLDKTGLRLAQAALAPKAPKALALRRGSIVRVMQQGKAWHIAQWPQAQGAMVALDPATGAVRALVGGFDFAHNQFNHVTQGWRQPGSSYKPFIYAGALDHGVMPETLVNDMPLANVGDWNPGNSDGSTDGPITVREALTHSKNLVTIRLVQLLGAPAMREWTARFGFDAQRQPDNLTLALGTGATTPLQLASAYGVLANGGYLLPSTMIKRIANSKGEVIFEAPAQVLNESLRVTSERNTFITNSLLQEVTRAGTAARAQTTLKRPDLYGKTGTTNEVVDAWFAGFQPGLVAVVWLGHDDPRSLGSHASGASLALPAWIEFMATALKDVPVRELSPPEGVLKIDGNWRYAEWALGGGIASLGLDNQVIGPGLIPKVPVVEVPATQ
ncbi:penicillin-binding protein 1A [Rhodoferax sp.]|uniref:penicillin-binding protein 1A n=1 Tax=Rhodoferax sp. TaxID=50421 RepID=UPI0025DFFF82|nr:PBP1A family penicillin-binding protein [Rhodoferax sp.]